MKKNEIKLDGLNCKNCALKIEKNISELDGINFIQVNLEDSNLIVEYDDSRVDLKDIEEEIKELGYIVK